MSGKYQKVYNAIDVAAALLLVFIFLSRLIPAITRDNIKWVDVIFDDAYYYLGVVRNIVENGVSAYSAPYETNGYQPLWLLVLCLSASLFGTSDTSLVIQILSLSFIFAGIFSYASRVKFGCAFPAIAACLSFPYVALYGLETTLIPILVLGLFGAKEWRLKGVLSSLLFLARLDALAFIVVNDVYRYFRKKDVNIRHYFILFPVICIYFFINYKIFGVPVPISGLSKSIGNVIGENISVYAHYALSVRSALGFLVLIFVPNIFSKNKIEIKYLDEIAICLLSVVPISTYYAFMSGWPLWAWYFWVAQIAYFYVLLSVIAQIETISGRVLPNIFKLMQLLLIFMVSFSPLKVAKNLTIQTLQSGAKSDENSSYGKKNIELVELIKSDKNIFVPGTFFAMGDRAGSFGFFLGKGYGFLQTEGLVGSYDYYVQMKNNKGAEFLRNSGARYLIADREKFMRYREIIGVVEPVQGMSVKYGSYLLCFNKNGVVLDQSYRDMVNNERYVFDLKMEIRCPQEMIKEFRDLQAKYGALRRFTFPSDKTQDIVSVEDFARGIIPFSSRIFGR